MNKKFLVPLAAVLAVSFFILPPSDAEAKKYYRSRKDFSVTGNGTNADASVVYVGGISTTTNHYRKITFPGLKMSNPFSYRVFRQNSSNSAFGEELWSLADHYFITSGNLWLHYGDSRTSGGNTTYSDYSVGNRRYFQYYGGTKKKKRKNSAYKTYEFNVSGSEGDADATAREDGETTTYYYRKVSVPELKMDNLVDFRLYSRNDFPQGFDEESWMLENSDFFLADGYLFVAYGYKTGSNYYNFDSDGDTYRFFSYSDGKRKKSRLKKQYVKKYGFSIPNDPNVADKVASYTYDDGYTSYEYYKKYPIKGAKKSGIPNIEVTRRNSFAEGYTSESWSHVDYAVTDGYLWVMYGYKDVDPEGAGEYTDYASGEYRIFSYR